MKSTILSKLSLLLLLILGMNSCSNHEEDITLERIHYATKANSCEDALKWIPYGNPNNSEYTATSKLGLLTIEYKKSKFDRKNLAVNENRALIETLVDINSLVVDNANGDIYECTYGKVYAVDKGNYSKTLLVQSEVINTTGNYIINNSILYFTKQTNEFNTIEIIEYNLVTNEHSVLYTATRQDERKYKNHLNIGSKNNNLYISIESADDKSNYIQTFSLDMDEIMWEIEIGNVANPSRWLTSGKYFIVASLDGLKTYDIATGKLILETSLDDYDYKGILDDHAILTRDQEQFRLVNLENGNITYQKKGRVIDRFNSVIYSINQENLFESYDLKTRKELFCSNLNTIEESKSFSIWRLSPNSRHIVGTSYSCDNTSLIVLQY